PIFFLGVVVEAVALDAIGAGRGLRVVALLARLDVRQMHVLGFFALRGLVVTLQAVHDAVRLVAEAAVLQPAHRHVGLLPNWKAVRILGVAGLRLMAGYTLARGTGVELVEDSLQPLLDPFVALLVFLYFEAVGVIGDPTPHDGPDNLRLVVGRGLAARFESPL